MNTTTNRHLHSLVLAAACFAAGTAVVPRAAMAGPGAAVAIAHVTSAEADPTIGPAVTFSRDVLPILQRNCQTCHRHGGDNYTGMVAPMSLITYDEVRPWAKSIAKKVE